MKDAPAPAPAHAHALRVVHAFTRRGLGAGYDLAMQVRPKDALSVVRGDPDPLVLRFTPAPRGAAVDVLASRDLDDAERASAEHVAVGIAGLDDDPGDFAERVSCSALLRDLHARFPGARMTRTATVWETLARAIVGQLVTWIEARDATRRMIRRYGAPIAGTDLRAFPTAASIAATSPADLRALGVGMRRATTLVACARLGERLEKLPRLPLDDAMKWLVSLRGIGPWTSQCVAIEALGHSDGVLVGDAGAPFVVTMALSGVAGDDARMLELLEPYRPHRARVHRLLDLGSRMPGGLPGVPRRPLPTVDPHRRWPGRR